MCDSQGSTASRRYRFVTESRGKPLFEPYTTCVTDRSRWGWPQKRTRLAAQRPQCAAAASTPVIFSWKSLDKKTCQIISSQVSDNDLTNFSLLYVSLMNKRIFHGLDMNFFNIWPVFTLKDSLLSYRKTCQITVFTCQRTIWHTFLLYLQVLWNFFLFVETVTFDRKFQYCNLFS